MTAMLKQLKSLFPILQTTRTQEEAYLGGATDISELERRMRSLEARSRSLSWAAPASSDAQGHS
jgi:hypothetical protein